MKITVTKGIYSIVYSINKQFYSVTLKSGSLASLFSFHNGLDLYHWEKNNGSHWFHSDLERIPAFHFSKFIKKGKCSKVQSDNNSERLRKPSAHSKGDKKKGRVIQAE